MRSKWLAVVALLVGCAISAGIFIGVSVVTRQDQQGTRQNQQAGVNTRLAHLSQQLAADEHKSCVIQARGLPAGHELAAGLGGLHVLLSTLLKQSAHVHHRHLSRIRQGEARQDLILTRQASAHLGAYARIESKQPSHRNC